MEGVSSGAVSNQVNDVANAEVVFVIGANPTVNHPVAATWIKNAVKNGAKLIVADPRRSDLARHATHFLQFKPDTDVALLNAMMHTIVHEGLVDEDFIRSRTIGYDELKRNVANYSPEAMAPVCGIPAETIKTVARLYAKSKGLDDLVGHGHLAAYARHRQRALPDRAVHDDRPDRPAGHRPASAARPEQRAGRVRLGIDPDGLSGLPARRQPRRARASKNCGARRSIPSRASRWSRSWTRCTTGKIRGMYIMGENPAMSDPDAHHAREALAKLDHLVVQEIFLTETCYYADVILPATAWPEKTGTVTNTDRMVQLGRQALDAPGEAKPDLWIIQEIARRMGLDWNYDGPRDVFNEMRKAMNSIAGITWERLERESCVTYPCEKEGRPGRAGGVHRRVPDADRARQARAGRHHSGRGAARRANSRSC